MIHLYIEGSHLQEVPEEFAQGRIEAGAWYRCETSHNLPEKYADTSKDEITVYHNNIERRTA